MRPLMNVLAVRSHDPELLSELATAWAASVDFGAVERYAGGWVVGTGQLSPDSWRVADHVEGGSLLVAEGHDQISDVGWFGHTLDLASTGLAEQPGDVGALMVKESGEAVVMRSAAGLVPWYFHTGSDGFVAVGTRLAWFSRHVPVELPMDVFAHAVATDGISTVDRRTPLVGVDAIPPGHVVRIDQDGSRRWTRYWRPELLTPSRFARDDAVERGKELRDHVLRRLERDLDPSGGNLLALSGGVDSSCLGALAAGPARMPIDAFTFLPGRDHPALEHVESYVRSIAAVLAPGRHWRFHLTEERRLEAHGRAPAVGMPVPHPALSHLREMCEEGDVRVYTGGEAADDLFAGDFVLGKDWIENISVLQLIGSLRRPWVGVARRFVARQWWESARGKRPIPLPVDDNLAEVFLPEIREQYRDWVLDLSNGLARSSHPYRHLLLFLQFDGWLRQNWEVCSELGVRRSFPFWTREVIELAFGAHPRIHALPSKRIIRAGFRDDVPAYNLDRDDKGAWSERATVGWSRVIPDRLSGLVKPDLIGQAPASLGLFEADLLMVLMASTRPIDRPTKSPRG